jgi:putative MATE family efflux protein
VADVTLKAEQDAKFIKMTTEPVHKLIVELAIPTILSMMVTSFYNTVDTFFVSQLGTSASAAVGVNFAFMSIIQACGFFFGHGSGNYISRKLGSKERAQADTMASTGYFYAFLSGLILIAICYPNAGSLAVALGSTPTILPYARTFLQIIILGSPFMMSSLVLNNQLRFQGSAMYGMIGIISGAILNIFLEPLLIFYFEMGIAGAATATVISQFIGMCVLLVMTTKGGNLTIHWRKAKFSVKLFQEIIMGGSPSLFRQGLESVGTIVLNVAAGVYGDAAIAAMSIVNRLSFLAAAAMIGFGQGYQPVCGFNYGARIFKRVRESFSFCLKSMTGVSLILSILGFIFAPSIIRIFRDDPEVIYIGVLALRAQAITFFLQSLVVLSNMTLQTVRKTGGAILLAMARRGLFLIPFLFIFPKFWGVNGLILCQPMADIAAVLLSFLVIRMFFKHLPKENDVSIKIDNNK